MKPNFFKKIQRYFRIDLRKNVVAVHESTPANARARKVFCRTINGPVVFPLIDRYEAKGVIKHRDVLQPEQVGRAIVEVDEQASEQKHGKQHQHREGNLNKDNNHEDGEKPRTQMHLRLLKYQLTTIENN
jgi:hypothetical protein